MTPGVGLSVGATNVAAVAAGGAATRRSVLTLYRHRPPEVGVPSENPRLAAGGLVVTGFVDRAGDPVGLMAADGSFHRAEVLIADALCALTRTMTGRRPQVPPGVTFPAHWRASAVDALRRELAKRPEWAVAKGPTLVSDAEAALAALQAEPGLQTRGVVALCDFGGTGTSITVADATEGYRPIGATVRHTDFSGEFVDRALLAHVIADLSIAGTGDVTGTSAIGSLHRLRTECRGAKERLSRGAVTTMFADLPGFHGDVRLNRSELDDEIRRPLTSLVEVLREMLFRNRIQPADLAAVATVGGGANIPAVTAALSQQLRVPVITGPHPELTAARGAAIRAVRLPEDDSLTAVASPVQSGTLRALAWSQSDDAPDIAPMAIRSRRVARPTAVSPTARHRCRVRRHGVRRRGRDPGDPQRCLRDDGNDHDDDNRCAGTDSRGCGAAGGAATGAAAQRSVVHAGAGTGHPRHRPRAATGDRHGSPGACGRRAAARRPATAARDPAGPAGDPATAGAVHPAAVRPSAIRRAAALGQRNPAVRSPACRGRRPAQVGGPGINLCCQLFPPTPEVARDSPHTELSVGRTIGFCQSAINYCHRN